MRILTIDGIRENPWNIITHSLPANPSPLLVGFAFKAADYCRESELMISRALLDGSDDSQAEAARFAADESMKLVKAANNRVREILRHCERRDGSYVLMI